MRLDTFLAERHIPFERMQHDTCYSANRVAQLLHVPGREVAKSVLVRTGEGYALAVLPATHRVNIDRLRRELREERLEMATEDEMVELFPDCERGAMPPFGSLYNLPTVVDETLTRDKRIVFENQNHTEALSISYRDFDALEHPRHGRFAERARD